MIGFWFWFIGVDDDFVIMLIFLKFRNYFLMFFGWFFFVVFWNFDIGYRIKIFFYGLFYEKSTFFSLASFGLIRRNFAMSRINWLGNKFFFFFCFFLFFLLWILSFEKFDFEFEIWIILFSLSVSGWVRLFYFRNFVESNSAFSINGGKSSGTLSMIGCIEFICMILTA